MNIILIQTLQMHSTTELFLGNVKAVTPVNQLTDKLDEEAAIVDQYPFPTNLDVHLDKHLGSVQMADEQPLPTCCRDSSQWAPAAVFISAQDKGRHKNCGSEKYVHS